MKRTLRAALVVGEGIKDQTDFICLFRYRLSELIKNSEYVNLWSFIYQGKQLVNEEHVTVREELEEVKYDAPSYPE